jgi:hypothetical protein
MENQMNVATKAPTSDLVQHQVLLEQTYSKNQLIPRVKSEFENCKEVPFADQMIEHGIPIPFGMDVLTQMAIHKRANLQTMMGVMYHHFKDAQLTADMLIKCAKADLITYSVLRSEFIVIFTISEDVQADLDRFQFPLPLVVPPKELENNRSTGYFLGGGSVILRQNHHDNDVCLDHINRMNKIRFVINDDVAKMVKNRWKKLDRIKPGETKQKYEQRKRAFEKYDRTAKDVMEFVMKEADHFHLTNKYDKRGRTYCVGYHCNTQGTAWNKAVIELADKEICE